MDGQFGRLGNHKRLGMSFDACAHPLPTKANKLCVMNPYERNGLLEISSWHRNGFSKSLGDLTRMDSTVESPRRTVMFEEDLQAHAVMLDRARSRFRELELKYPEVFRNSPRTPSVSTLKTWQGSRMLQKPSFGLTVEDDSTFENHDQSQEVEVKENDGLGKLSEVRPYRKLSSGTQRRKAPLLSPSMRSHHLEDSCDSAFDEIDRESVNSRTSQDRSPTTTNSRTSSSRFLYPGDSLESDKDSGISSDQSFIPTCKPPIYPKRATFAESDHGSISGSKSISLSQPSLVVYNSSKSESDEQSKKTIDRQGILKSTAFRNQGIRNESLDVGFPLEDIKYEDRKQRLRAPRSGSSDVYRRSIFHLPSFNSLHDADSDADTVYSIKSEVIVRPKLSAHQLYLSTYGLNRINNENDCNHNCRLYKSASVPNLRFSHSSYDSTSGFGGGLMYDNPKKRKKRILQRFGRRSGLYIVNDVPTLEKPKLPFSSSSSKRKRSKLKKSASLEPTHVTESTKVWYDHTTAVSRPSQGYSLGRIVAMREDIGMAYEIELQRPCDKLFGFFIQKGYKQFRKGIFISRIMDSHSAKFLAGLLNPGDELIEINHESTKTKTVAEVHNILANCDKLLLTILPFIGRKDW